MSKLVCTSPVDGTIYAERPLADDGAVAAAIARARAAQAEGAIPRLPNAPVYARR